MLIRSKVQSNGSDWPGQRESSCIFLVLFQENTFYTDLEKRINGISKLIIINLLMQKRLNQRVPFLK